MNLPSYEFLSAPLWLVTTLHLLTLALHFIGVGFVFGGSIIAVHAVLRRGGQDPALIRVVRLFPVAMAATVTLGVAPLLFVQLVYPRQIYAAAIVSGWFWLLVVAAVLLAYTAAYVGAERAARCGQVPLPAVLILLAGLVYVWLVYGSVFALAERPDLLRQLYARAQSGLVWNPDGADYIWRSLHMLLGAVAIAGFVFGVLGGSDPGMRRTAAMFFAGGMGAASLAGVAYLVTSPVLLALMHSPGIPVLAAAVVLSLGSLHFFFRRKFAAAGAMLFVSVLGMTYVRHTVRLLRLASEFDPGSWRVAPQWGPFLLFLVCFVVALGLVTYMLTLFFGSKERRHAPA